MSRFDRSFVCAVSMVAILSMTGFRSALAQTQRISVSSAEVQDNTGVSTGSYITPDGRYVAFTSTANDLVAGDTNGVSDVFVRDLWTGTTVRVSVPDAGVAGSPSQGNEASMLGRSGVNVMSDDGRFVVFQSMACNLVSNDHVDGSGCADENLMDIFVRDRDLDGNGVYDEPGAGKTRTVRVSLTSNENPAVPSCLNGICSGHSSNPSISANGRYVAFESEYNFAGGGSFTNIFRRDRDTDNDKVYDEPAASITEWVDTQVSCVGCAQDGFSSSPAISGTGRYIAFVSRSTHVIFSDNNSADDIFVRDMNDSNTTTSKHRVSVDSAENESQANRNSSAPSISFSGRYIAFVGTANNLVAGDTNNVADVFVRDRGQPNPDGSLNFASGTTLRASLGISRALPQNPLDRFTQLDGTSQEPAISWDGSFVAFVTSDDTVVCNLLCLDGNLRRDVYLRDWRSGSEYTYYISGGDSPIGGPNGHSAAPSVTLDGALISFSSLASDLLTPDANGASSDVYAASAAGMPVLMSVASRRTHGAAGTFDQPLPITGTTIGLEPREGGPSQLVFTFSEAVSHSGGGTSFVSSGPLVDSWQFSGNQVIAHLSGVPDPSCAWLMLGDFVDASGNAILGIRTVSFRTLQGDGNESALVTGLDVTGTKALSGQAPGPVTFLKDVNADGEIDAADIIRVKARLNNAVSCN